MRLALSVRPNGDFMTHAVSKLLCHYTADEAWDTTTNRHRCNWFCTRPRSGLLQGL